MRFGHAACKLIAEGNFGRMVALKGNDIISIKIEAVAGVTKSIPLDHDLLKLARDVGTEFGD